MANRYYQIFTPYQLYTKLTINYPGAGHFSKLTLVFDQGYDSTNLRYTWEGVPIGQEDTAKKNFNEYYVKSIKTTFGYEPYLPSLMRLLLSILPALIALAAYYNYFPLSYLRSFLIED